MKDERHVRQRRAAGARWRPAAILLAAVLVFLSLPLAGKAADVTSGVPNGSLKVAPGNDQLIQDLAKANVRVDIYRIANAQRVSGYDTYEFIPTQPFNGLSIPNSPDTTNEQWVALAQEAAGIVLGTSDDAEWNPSETADAIQRAEPTVFYSQEPNSGSSGDGNTVASFPELPLGMYLVLAHGDGIADYAKKTEDGSDVTIARTDVHEYTFSPVLITIPTKGKEIVEGVERINTANTGPWLFNVEASLKPKVEDMNGNLAIIKTLENYEEHEISAVADGTVTQVADDATFVFEVSGYPNQENYESKSPTVIYHDFISIVFKGAGERKALISNLPVGMYVEVSEVYSGRKYSSHEAQFATIGARSEVEVRFRNTYDDKTGGGGSVTNKFSYNANQWELKKGEPDNTEGAGEADVLGVPNSSN